MFNVICAMKTKPYSSYWQRWGLWCTQQLHWVHTVQPHSVVLLVNPHTEAKWICQIFFICEISEWIGLYVTCDHNSHSSLCMCTWKCHVRCHTSWLQYYRHTVYCMGKLEVTLHLLKKCMKLIYILLELKRLVDWQKNNLQLFLFIYHFSETSSEKKTHIL